MVIISDKKDIRIDIYLSNYLNKTRSQIQKYFLECKVLVNNNIAKRNYIINIDDEIVINDLEKKEIDIKLDDIHIDIDIVYEDDNLIVINKPKNLVCHKSLSHEVLNLSNILLKRFKTLSNIDNNDRPGIVHRLDKDTTGLLVVAKDNETHISLQEQLKTRTLKRVYHCIVYGQLDSNSGVIDAPIKRSSFDRKKYCVAEGGKDSITRFSVLERFKDYSYLKVVLDTGRTHQIRVHMSYIKHPVLGDPLYGPKKVYKEYGQYLHSKEISFIHPKTKKLMHFEIELPKYFTDELNLLKSN